MRRPLLLAVSVTLLLASTVPTGAEASVIVLSNELDKPVYCAVGPPDRKLQAYRIAAGDVLPVPVRGRVTVRFSTGRKVVDRSVMPADWLTVVVEPTPLPVTVLLTKSTSVEAVTTKPWLDDPVIRFS